MAENAVLHYDALAYKTYTHTRVRRVHTYAVATTMNRKMRYLFTYTCVCARESLGIKRLVKYTPSRVPSISSPPPPPNLPKRFRARLLPPRARNIFPSTLSFRTTVRVAANNDRLGAKRRRFPLISDTLGRQRFWTRSPDVRNRSVRLLFAIRVCRIRYRSSPRCQLRILNSNWYN